MKNFKLVFFTFAFFIFVESAFAQNKPFYPVYKRKAYKEIDSLRGALRPERTCFDVVYYDLQVEIIVKKKSIVGISKTTFKVVEATQKIQLDLYGNLKIDSIMWRNQKLSMLRKYDAVFIYFPKYLQPNQVEEVAVYYQGSPVVNVGDWNRHGFHWDKDDKLRNWISVSCEQDGASLWWANKDHLSDEPDSMRIHIIAPAEFVCISNGRLEKQTRLEKTKQIRHDWFVRNPINNYNVTFYLGHYIKKNLAYKNDTGEHIIETYALDYEHKKMQDYFRLVPEFVAFFEKIYGEYPFWNDKFAVVQSSYSGMEHQTCLAIGRELYNYNNWYYSHTVNYHSTLIHEIAHEWWGNSISVKDMADVWLHEAFATYSEFAFLEYAASEEIYEKSLQKSSIFIKGNYPIVGNREVNENMFTEGDIYHRGAKVIHELRQELNNFPVFLRIHKTFLQRFRHKTVTTDDYIQVVNEISGRDLTKFLMDRLYKK
jgi:aminopeptidase N